MSAKEHFDIATHIYTRLRRLSSRTIDVIWMVHNADYAHEVLKLARASNDAETIRLAERFDQLAFGTAETRPGPQSSQKIRTPAAVAAAEADSSSDERYVGALR